MNEQSQQTHLAAANEPFTPQMALARVRAALPAGLSQSVAIHCDVWSHPPALRAPSDPPIEVGFRVWDGSSVFAAATLEQAVSACLAAHRPARPDEQTSQARAFFADAQTFQAPASSLPQFAGKEAA